ncbi:hypothetical protein [Actinomadura madurae]|uniref:hypothetical protein n=1 Tax=Actinomadura madurae TaxID=1993 RepID=UPI0020D205DC|nr:hypothetical protein [Actinomadura madurae]MCQ0012064.1 hypothetical protein [Actinomadura madurae]
MAAINCCTAARRPPAGARTPTCRPSRPWRTSPTPSPAGWGSSRTPPGGVTALHRHWCASPHDDCPGPGTGRCYDIGGRAGSGAFYTPRPLAEQVTDGALEALVYQPGPLQTGDEAEWRLRPSAEIIALTVGDIAVGSGAFSVAAVRYLAGRVVEAWAAEGVVGDLMAARRAVLRCVFGADVNEPAAELAKIALWLITYDPGQPNLSLDPQFVVGDSLLGITNLQQLAWMHVDAERGKTLHAKDPALVAFPRHLATCVTVLTRRRLVPNDGQEPTAEASIVQIALDVVTEISKPLADLATGAALASGCKTKEWERLSMEAAHLAAACKRPPPVGRSPVEVAMPVVYATLGVDLSAVHTAAQESGALFAVDTDTSRPVEADEVWHIADPTTDHLPTWALRDDLPRTWFMCGRLGDLGDAVQTRTLPASAVVCPGCLEQVEQVNALLASYLRVAAEGLRTVLAGEGVA